MCYKPTMHFLTLFGKRCFLLWPGHNHALLRAPQKKACVLRKFIGTFASNTKVKKASMLSILTAKKKKKRRRAEEEKTEDPKCPKDCKYRIFYTEFPFSPNLDAVVPYQVVNLHEVTDLSVTVCLDSFRKEL